MNMPPLNLFVCLGLLLLLLACKNSKLTTELAQVPVSDISERAFYDTQLKEYGRWLASSGLDNYLDTDSIAVSTEMKGSASLYLKVEDRSTWQDLKYEFDSRYKQYLGTYLFDKFCFMMQIMPTRGTLIITSRVQSGSEGLFVKINANKTIDVEDMRSGGSSTGIDFSGDNTISGRTILSLEKEYTTQTISDEIEDYFKYYYKDKGHLLGMSQASCRIVRAKNTLICEVTNLKGEIIYDCNVGCYFEIIRHQVSINSQDEGHNLTYHLLGGYGSGIFSAPRKNFYKDMNIEYKDYIFDYKLTFMDKLKNHLAQKFPQND